MIHFTIITCTFNAEKLLQRTLDSVRQQTYDRIEHLILDGSSTDGTLSLAQTYQKQSADDDAGHEVVVVSEPDKGLYDAMNKGLARATGDYVVYLNAGDSFPDEQTLNDIAASVGEGEELPAVLYGETDLVDEMGNFLRHRRLQAPDNLTWKSFRQGMLVCHQAFYARTDLAKNTPYNLRYLYSADVDWCIRIMKQAQKQNLTLRNVQRVVANYLAEGMTTKNHRASLWERFRIQAKHYGLFTTVGLHLWFVVRAVLKR